LFALFLSCTTFLPLFQKMESSDLNFIFCQSYSFCILECKNLYHSHLRNKFFQWSTPYHSLPLESHDVAFEYLLKIWKRISHIDYYMTNKKLPLTDFNNFFFNFQFLFCNKLFTLNIQSYKLFGWFLRFWVRFSKNWFLTRFKLFFNELF
jgi:hypothetical protein